MIKVKAITGYFGIKRALFEALRHFQQTKDSNVDVFISYEDGSTIEGSFNVMDLYHYLGFDFIKNPDKLVTEMKQYKKTLFIERKTKLYHKNDIEKMFHATFKLKKN